MKIFVTGAAGQLGSEFVRLLQPARHVVASTRRDLDLGDGRAVLARVHAERPDLIVNCAAYNDVDGAEEHVVPALEANAMAVRALARGAVEIGATLVHYSTDFVFDGAADRPYREEDPPNPQSVYARSKLLGEAFAHDAGRVYVLRVESLFGGAAARSSADRIIDGLLAGREVTAFADRTVTPSYVADVARATMALVERGAAFGLYHCVNTGAVTWLDLARRLAAMLGVAAPRLRPVTLDSMPLRAARPRYCALSNEKLAAAGVAMPHWEDAMRRHLATRRLTT
jgi:dTDP-4-dehydrorhamnose reductase